MTIVATPKATNANSYATLAEANAYHDTRLHNAEWSSASEADKEKALKMATRALDQLMWKGVTTTSTQVLKFPRAYLLDIHGNYQDSDTIPTQLVEATAELAWLLIVKDSTRESTTKGIKSVGAGPVNVVFDKTDRARNIPDSVIDMVGHWIESRGTVRLARG